MISYRSPHAVAAWGRESNGQTWRRYATVRGFSLFRIDSPSLVGGDPLYILKQTPAGNNSYDTSILHRATMDELPWASISGDKPETQRTWPVIVPINVDDDSIALRYTEGSHRLVFTEPIIIAALAATPCDPAWGQSTDACTTSFGKAESSSVSTEDSYTITAGGTVGFEQEFSVLGVKAVGIEILARVDAAATETVSTSYTLTKRVVHTTGPIEDSVLFTTIRWTSTPTRSPRTLMPS